MKSLFICFSFMIYLVQAWSPTSRLQRDAIPKAYSLKLVPNINNATFTGEVTILIEIAHSMNNITLNSEELIISEVILDQAIGRTKYVLDEKSALIHVSYFDQNYINPGEHILHIKFGGTLHQNGFYSKSFETNGTIRTFVATKFSSTNARAAFPCFDEPYFKSVFSVRLIKPNNTWTALSNMKEIGSFNTSQGIAVDFQSTVPMSTYLLAWILTDYTYEQRYFKGKDKVIPLRLFTSEERSSERKKLLDATERALEFFENYTNIPYALPKLDSIEIPHYRSSGMEHWGLIVYQEGTLTYKPAYHISPLENYIEALTLITHEVAHMWFGNLVTHEWYNDLWLTEGFARFMQFKAIAYILKEPFVASMLQYGKLSYLHNTQCGRLSNSLTETVQYPRAFNEIYRKFLPTTYDQGAAVLMMLENVMGPEKMQEAVRKHLTKHQFSFATTGDFINTVQSVAPDINVRGLMESYLFQKKFPMINVTEEGDKYVLRQASVCGIDKSMFGNKWTVPIKYITSSNRTSRTVWFDRDMSQLSIPKSPSDRWIKINHLNQGFYRTNYTVSLFTALQNDFQELHADDKGSLLQDAFLLAAFGNISCGIPLQLLGSIKNFNEIDYATLRYLITVFDIFSNRIDIKMDTRVILYSYILFLIEPLQQKMGWTIKSNDTVEQRLLRTKALDIICRELDYKLCVDNVEKIRAGNQTIHEDIAHIYRAVQRYSKEEIEANAQKLENSEYITHIPEETTTTEPLSQESECSSWIRENIPKLLEKINTI